VDLRLAGRAALPVLAVLAWIGGVAAILAAAGSTLGYDYLMYDGAAHRLMAGGALYDLSFSAPGPNGLFDYPPTFILAVIPFAATLPPHVASLAWIAMLNLAFVAGVAILPVRRETRWAVLLLAGLSWPYLYAVKLGQLGPPLFLLYAIAWRWADRPAAAGLSAAVGTCAKLQPLLLFGWALATRRFRAVAFGLGVLVAGALLASLVAGLGAWTDWIDLIARVGSNALTAPQVLSIGAIAYRAGVPLAVASALQWASAAAAGAVALVAWVRYPASVAIVVTAVASVLVSPIVWAHYAVILLLPVALLLDRRHWWAVALPIVTWLPIDAVYPVVFAIGLLAPLAVGEQMRRSSSVWPDQPSGQGPRSPVLSSRS
jgi:hypothetical protein